MRFPSCAPGSPEHPYRAVDSERWTETAVEACTIGVRTRDRDCQGFARVRAVWQALEFSLAFEAPDQALERLPGLRSLQRLGDLLFGKTISFHRSSFCQKEGRLSRRF